MVEVDVRRKAVREFCLSPCSGWWLRARSLLILACLAWLHSACSFTSVRGVGLDGRSGRCTTSSSYPTQEVLMSLVGLGLSGLTTYWAAETWEQDSTGIPVASALLFSTLTAVGIASASYGFKHVNACREAYRREGRAIPVARVSPSDCLALPGLIGLVAAPICAAGVAAKNASSSRAKRQNPRTKDTPRARHPTQSLPLKVPTYEGPLCDYGRKPIARCHDASYSCAKKVSEACREQGGVRTWVH